MSAPSSPPETPGAARARRLRSLLVCPRCRGELAVNAQDFRCGRCGEAYPILDGIPRFAQALGTAAADAAFQAAQMYNSTFTARLYNAGRRVLSSEYAPVDHVARFLAGVPYGSVTVELGSGDRRLRSDVLNLDLFPFPNVDMAADVAATPLRDNSVEFAILDSVLEHVPEPHAVVDELYRILKPGGQAICITPFVFPYHGYPKHYFNISRDGMEHLCRRFAECRMTTAVGPTSGLVNLVSEYVGVAVGGENKLLYTLGKGAALAPTFLFKYLDRLWSGSERSQRLAATLCAHLRK